MDARVGVFFFRCSLQPVSLSPSLCLFFLFFQLFPLSINALFLSLLFAPTPPIPLFVAVFFVGINQ